MQFGKSHSADTENVGRIGAWHLIPLDQGTRTMPSHRFLLKDPVNRQIPTVDEHREGYPCRV